MSNNKGNLRFISIEVNQFNLYVQIRLRVIALWVISIWPLSIGFNINRHRWYGSNPGFWPAQECFLSFCTFFLSSARKPILSYGHSRPHSISRTWPPFKFGGPLMDSVNRLVGWLIGPVNPFPLSIFPFSHRPLIRPSVECGCFLLFRVDLNLLKTKSARTLVKNVNTDFWTIFLNWCKMCFWFVFRTCFGWGISRACGTCESSYRSAEKTARCG